MMFCAITFCQYFSKNVWLRRKIDNSVRLRNLWQMCSLQTSTGRTLMHRVVEKMGATELRKKYDLRRLFFWRLAGGAEDDEPPEDNGPDIDCIYIRDISKKVERNFSLWVR
jgi:hypothetical protein